MIERWGGGVPCLNFGESGIRPWTPLIDTTREEVNFDRGCVVGRGGSSLEILGLEMLMNVLFLCFLWGFGGLGYLKGGLVFRFLLFWLDLGRGGRRFGV